MADTRKWEQQAAFILDTSPHVHSFAKNAGLGFAITYFHNGQSHEYVPDFLVRLNSPDERYLILETKGWDPLEEVKTSAAMRWINAVNATARHGFWEYQIAKKPELILGLLEHCSLSENRMVLAAGAST